METFVLPVPFSAVFRGVRLIVCAFILWCTCIFSGPVFAQTHRSCSTVEVNKQHAAARMGVDTEESFEQWLADKIQLSKNALNRTSGEIYTVPVVVHVIHNGEAIGTGTNISDAQVQSQIRILNEDFRRKAGTRGFNTHPDGADTEIEFRLALTNPDGFPTTGIVRVQSTRQTWNTDEEVALKSLSYWNSQFYLNIWVCNLETGTLGYAQFPESDQIQGVSDIGEENGSLDGVVVGYKYFGDEGAVLVSGNDFRFGRTTTHEVGHFLGLRHIWGDAPFASLGCAFDDYCADTPNTRQANYDCPASDSTTCTTPKLREMVENYMDYTDDACMNIFTEDQKLRMRTVLENSPRRASLLTSPGLSAVTLVANNIGIERVQTPGSFICGNVVSPVVVVRNFGSNPVSSVRFTYQISNGSTVDYTWNGQLATAARDTVYLPAASVSPGTYVFGISVVQVNGQSDTETANNTAQSSFQAVSIQSVPFWANFDKALLYEGWMVWDEDNTITWRDTLVSRAGNSRNRAAYLNYYQSTTTDEQDALLTAPYNLSEATQAYLMFDVSYARRQSLEDGLEVMVSTDCGNTFNSENTIYQKTGSRLSTATSASFQAWYPTLPEHWRTETINLSGYIGQESVRFAFVGTNTGGNNMYVDNIRVVFRTNTIEEEVNGYKDLPNAFQIYPNPSRGRFNVRFNVYEPRNVQVQVYSSLGQQVYSTLIDQAKDSYEVDLAGLPAGMYLVNAFGDGEKVTRRIVISH
jgi:hypothetical protein